MSEGFIPGLRYRSPAQELWALVVESFQGWEERVNGASAAAGLSPVSAWALVQLDPDQPISQKELASRLRCNPSTVVDPTDRLEEGELVVRRTHATDRRVNVLVVTEKGRRVRDDLIGRLDGTHRSAAPHIDDVVDHRRGAVGRFVVRPNPGLLEARRIGRIDGRLVRIEA